MTDTPKQLTKAAFDRLQAELDELTTKGRKEMAEKLQRARELGDLKENAEYHETKNQQGLMEARIRTIQSMLREAEIIEAPAETDAAVAGTIVTIKDAESGDEDRYLLATTREEKSGDPEVRTVTTESPLGEALVGKKVGEIVSYQTPNGRELKYELTAVAPFQG